MQLPLASTFGDSAVAEIFDERSSIEAWLETERALAHAQAELGVIPREAAAEIECEAIAEKIDSELLRERMAVVGYPILPLLEQIRAGSPDTVGDYLHWGTTTQDIMDTARALQISRALDRIDSLVNGVGSALVTLSDTHRGTVMAGRTHGQPAVPTTLGAKLAVLVAEFDRHRGRLRAVRSRATRVSLFGAGGTNAAMGTQGRRMRELLAQRLGLGETHVPWHTARDSLAELGFALGAVAGTCGKLGREVVDLSRPEIGELSEASGHMRGASSTMPQKANPIESEMAIAFSLLAAQQVSALLTTMQPEHERPAGEWGVEWDSLPLAFAYGAGALGAMGRLLEGLRVFPERMRSNLELDGGLIMAEAAMMALAPSLGRGPAHDLVYEASVAVREAGIALPQAIREAAGDELDGTVDLDAALRPEAYLGEVDAIVDEALALWRAES